MGNPAGVLAETALFSGRHAELETLRRLLTSAPEGEAATVVITGEYGVGKTALGHPQRSKKPVPWVSLLSWRKARALKSASVAESSARCRCRPGHPQNAIPRTRHVRRIERVSRADPESAKAPLFLAVDDVHVADTWSKRCLAHARPHR